MVRRRKIGPAYERSPLQKSGEWWNRNLLILVSALLAGSAFWFGTNWVVDGMLNFLASGGDEAKEKPFSSDDTMWIIIKLVGTSLAMLFVVKSRSK